MPIRCSVVALRVQAARMQALIRVFTRFLYGPRCLAAGSPLTKHFPNWRRRVRIRANVASVVRRNRAASACVPVARVAPMAGTTHESSRDTKSVNSVILRRSCPRFSKCSEALLASWYRQCPRGSPRHCPDQYACIQCLPTRSRGTCLTRPPRCPTPLPAHRISPASAPLRFQCRHIRP